MCVLDAIAPTVPAMVTDDLYDVIAQNPLNVALLGAVSKESGRRRNFIWRWFTDDGLRGRYLADQHEKLGREYVADLRASYGLRHGDTALRALGASCPRRAPGSRGCGRARRSPSSARP